MKNPKVHIILSTYNGVRFLKRQLDSLMAQTYDNITIYIRDDGSTDGTVPMLREYIQNHQSSKKLVLLENVSGNLRCPASFYEILRNCEPADYYSLCDQDDEWYPNKVEWAVQTLEAGRREDDSRPRLYYSASDYRTADGSFIRKSPVQKEQLSLQDVLFYTPGSGFTIVFNEAARRMLVCDVNPGEELHDRWLIRGAVCFGTVVYDQRSTAAHIRHEDAVTAGDSTNRSLLANFWHNELIGDHCVREKQALAYFLQTFGGQLGEDDVRTLQLFAGKRTPVTWFRKVFYPKRLRTRLGGELALRLLFILGRI